mmetsp:Transcript_32430/g.85648  ORF Transcript_32430/g.85648 Transcript_32430/m.85648 type:complete len:201 (-) Transcript_32430:460-1062(-)
MERSRRLPSRLLRRSTPRAPGARRGRWLASQRARGPRTDRRKSALPPPAASTGFPCSASQSHRLPTPRRPPAPGSGPRGRRPDLAEGPARLGPRSRAQRAAAQNCFQRRRQAGFFWSPQHRRFRGLCRGPDRRSGRRRSGLFGPADSSGPGSHGPGRGRRGPGRGLGPSGAGCGSDSDFAAGARCRRAGRSRLQPSHSWA